MLHRIHCLLVLAALAVLAAPAARASPTALDLVPSNSTAPAPAYSTAPAPAFQLNLAQRISTRVKQLRERRSPTKTSRIGLAGVRKRTFSDELLDLIKGACSSPSPSHAHTERPTR